MPTVHLIYGSTGAGKTTKSLEISKNDSSVIFSIDEWMKTLYWKDAPSENVLEWALERVERCEDQIWSVSKNLLSKNCSVVLDLGFSKRNQRDKFRNLIKEAGFEAKVHFLDVDVETRKKRVQTRNAEIKSGDSSIKVSDETFDWMETYFEKPEKDELI